MKKCLLLLFTLGLSLIGHATDLYPLNSPQQEAQFQHLLKELRCVVCQNQDLSDSHAPLARDLRREVYLLVKKGETDQHIKDYLTTRYGDFILFKPAFRGMTVLLWLAPFCILGLGLWFFRGVIRRDE